MEGVREVDDREVHERESCVRGGLIAGWRQRDNVFSTGHLVFSLNDLFTRSFEGTRHQIIQYLPSALALLEEQANSSRCA